jgi:hypothetical protein
VLQFNVVLDDTDVLIEDMIEWRTMDAMQKRPPPLCIEVYLDMKDLTNSQTLVVIDESGKRWDVAEALNPLLNLLHVHRVVWVKPHKLCWSDGGSK